MLKLVGRGEAFWETGTEGVIWSVLTHDHYGIPDLYHLEDGDRLTVYDPKESDVVRWSGTVQLEYESHQETSYHNPEYRSQAIVQHWVHGLQVGLPAEQWADFFFQAYPMTLERATACAVRILDGIDLKSFLFDSYKRQEPGALLTVTHKLLPAHGRGRYMNRQEQWIALYLSLDDVQELRRSCDAVLSLFQAGDRSTENGNQHEK